MQESICSICRNATDNRLVVAEEMMFGLHDRFSYLECARCGCVQRLDPVDDLARYYPAGQYYSLEGGIPHGIAGLARKLRARSYFGASVIGRYLASRYPRADLAAVARLNPSRSWRILDVGCGGGKLLFDLAAAGFEYLRGVDPFIASDIHQGPVHIWKRTLADVPERDWDLIMFHHSLEHLTDQEQTLRMAGELLKPQGTCLVAVPIIGWAWRHYREKWVQLDAPRHVWLHSEGSLRMIAERAGLRVVATHHDSNELQFWGSELYRRGIRLRAEGAPRRFFPPKTLRRYRMWAERLNRRGMGDQASFLMVRNHASSPA